MILSQGQYEHVAEGKPLRLLRWRLNVEGKEGSWKPATPKGGNGGWPMKLNEADVTPAVSKN